MNIKLFSGLAIIAISIIAFVSLNDTEPGEKSSQQTLSIPNKDNQKTKPAANKARVTSSVKRYQASVFDYSNVQNTKEKKQLFFDTLRPIIKDENQRIRVQREQILLAKQANKTQPWINELAAEHKVDWNPEAPDWDTLLLHIDTIPKELVMVQAANESAWGASRFAQKGNNLFGQWCFTKGCGLVPSQRNSGAKHEVRKFPSINDSVASYLHNINTSHAYKSLRKIRAELRAKKQKIEARTLATGLDKYSTRGKKYVKEIQSMIKTNYSLMQETEKKSG